MTGNEFSAEFDLLYNNASSNQAPGLNEFEKSLLLTKALNELSKNYFTPVQGGNKYQQGIEDSNKRLSDFSCLIKVFTNTTNRNVTTRLEDLSQLLSLASYYYDIPETPHTRIRILGKAVLKIPKNAVPFMDIYPLTFTLGDSSGTNTLVVESLGEEEEDYTVYTFLIPTNSFFITDKGHFWISCEYREGTENPFYPISLYLGDILGTSFTAEFTYTDLEATGPMWINTLDPRGVLITFPKDLYILLHESVTIASQLYQVLPITHEEYQRLMSKPSGDPLKRQVWKLLGSNDNGDNGVMEIIPHWKNKGKDVKYTLRYVRTPYPIILEDLSSLGLTIEGKNKPWGLYIGLDAQTDGSYNVCELHPEIHLEIVQRAVELAKVAWASSQEEIAATLTHITSGLRSE